MDNFPSAYELIYVFQTFYSKRDDLGVTFLAKEPYIWIYSCTWALAS